MAIIEPVAADVKHPDQIKKYSAGLRFWHWANFIVISGSLLTVLINSTITNRHTTSALVKEALTKKGATVSDDQVGEVTHSLSDSVWDLHKYIGFFLAGLFLFRLILEFFQVTDQKFIRLLKNAYTQFKMTRENRQKALHELTVKIIYLAFYGCLLTMVVTGLFLAFEHPNWPLFKERHTIKSVHNLGMYVVLGFIAVHLAGVFLAERKKDGRGIVSDMINGGGNQEV